jgi:hypothetical protein
LLSGDVHPLLLASLPAHPHEATTGLDRVRAVVERVADAEVLLALHELRLREVPAAVQRGGVMH